MNTALRPCPFCGGEAEYTLTMAGWEAACKECGAAMPRRTTEDDCLAAWNTRVAVDDKDFALAVHDGELWEKRRTCRLVATEDDCISDCSECGVILGGCAQYCWNCGAKVVEE